MIDRNNFEFGQHNEEAGKDNVFFGGRNSIGEDDDRFYQQ